MDCHVVARYDIAAPVKPVFIGFTGTSFSCKMTRLGLIS